MNAALEKNLLLKLRELSPRQIAEVTDFVEFLASKREAQLARSASQASETSFAAIWDNEDDAAYDKL